LGGWGFWSLRHPQREPDQIWDEAQEDLKAGRYQQVQQALAQLARRRSPTPLDWFLKAQLSLAQNHPDEAVANLARVPDDHYMAARARLLAGQIERERDRVAAAEVALLQAVRIDPSLVQAHRELIYIFGMQLRRPEIGREFLVLQKLTKLLYEDAYHWTSLLSNYWEPGDVVGDLIRFVSADPSDRWSRLALASILRRMGLHQRAETTLAVLPASDPEARAIRVQIALDRLELDKAAQLLELGRSDDPELARLRGRLALAQRDPQSAANHFRIAHAADPGDHETLFGLRTALELLGETKAAASVRDDARNLDRLNTLLHRAAAGEARQNPSLIRAIGVACAALNRTAEARAWLEVAISRNPLDSESQRALFQLNAHRQSEAQTAAGAPLH
jgi:tetratricopeptide (TPR) repeat protein